jgi:hypothetical protein
MTNLVNHLHSITPPPEQVLKNLNNYHAIILTVEQKSWVPDPLIINNFQSNDREAWLARFILHSQLAEAETHCSLRISADNPDIDDIPDEGEEDKSDKPKKKKLPLLPYPLCGGKAPGIPYDDSAGSPLYYFIEDLYNDHKLIGRRFFLLLKGPPSWKTDVIETTLQRITSRTNVCERGRGSETNRQFEMVCHLNLRGESEQNTQINESIDASHQFFKDLTKKELLVSYIKEYVKLKKHCILNKDFDESGQLSYITALYPGFVYNQEPDEAQKLIGNYITISRDHEKKYTFHFRFPKPEYVHQIPIGDMDYRKFLTSEFPIQNCLATFGNDAIISVLSASYKKNKLLMRFANKCANAIPQEFAKATKIINKYTSEWTDFVLKIVPTKPDKEGMEALMTMCDYVKTEGVPEDEEIANFISELDMISMDQLYGTFKNSGYIFAKKKGRMKLTLEERLTVYSQACDHALMTLEKMRKFNTELWEDADPLLQELDQVERFKKRRQIQMTMLSKAVETLFKSTSDRNPSSMRVCWLYLENLLKKKDLDGFVPNFYMHTTNKEYKNLTELGEFLVNCHYTLEKEYGCLVNHGKFLGLIIKAWDCPRFIPSNTENGLHNNILQAGNGGVGKSWMFYLINAMIPEGIVSMLSDTTIASDTTTDNSDYTIRMCHEASHEALGYGNVKDPRGVQHFKDQTAGNVLKVKKAKVLTNGDIVSYVAKHKCSMTYMFNFNEDITKISDPVLQRFEVRIFPAWNRPGKKFLKPLVPKGAEKNQQQFQDMFQTLFCILYFVERLIELKIIEDVDTDVGTALCSEMEDALAQQDVKGVSASMRTSGRTRLNQRTLAIMKALLHFFCRNDAPDAFKNEEWNWNMILDLEGSLYTDEETSLLGILMNEFINPQRSEVIKRLAQYKPDSVAPNATTWNIPFKSSYHEWATNFCKKNNFNSSLVTSMLENLEITTYKDTGINIISKTDKYLECCTGFFDEFGGRDDDANQAASEKAIEAMSHKGSPAGLYDILMPNPISHAKPYAPKPLHLKENSEHLIEVVVETHDRNKTETVKVNGNLDKFAWKKRMEKCDYPPVHQYYNFYRFNQEDDFTGHKVYNPDPNVIVDPARLYSFDEILPAPDLAALLQVNEIEPINIHRAPAPIIVESEPMIVDPTIPEELQCDVEQLLDQEKRDREAQANEVNQMEGPVGEQKDEPGQECPPEQDEHVVNFDELNEEEEKRAKEEREKAARKLKRLAARMSEEDVEKEKKEREDARKRLKRISARIDAEEEEFRKRKLEEEKAEMDKKAAERKERGESSPSYDPEDDDDIIDFDHLTDNDDGEDDDDDDERENIFIDDIAVEKNDPSDDEGDGGEPELPKKSK